MPTSDLDVAGTMECFCWQEVHAGVAPESGLGPRLPELEGLSYPLSVYILPEPQILKRHSSSFVWFPVSVTAAPSPWSLHSIVGREADNVTPKGFTPGVHFLEPLEMWKEQGAPQGHVPGKWQPVPSICFRTP